MAADEEETFDIVVAMTAQSRGIGLGGQLPWRSLPGDMARFKEVTIGDGRNAVIMGRKTWDSIPERFKPLKNRTNIVLTRRPPEDIALPNGVHVAHDLEAALSLARACDARSVFVVGGAEVFAEAIQHPRCSTLWTTRVDAALDCDVFFPQIDPARFRESYVGPVTEERGVRYGFVDYVRRPSSNTQGRIRK